MAGWLTQAPDLNVPLLTLSQEGDAMLSDFSLVTALCRPADLAKPPSAPQGQALPSPLQEPIAISDGKCGLQVSSSTRRAGIRRGKIGKHFTSIELIKQQVNGLIAILLL